MTTAPALQVHLRIDSAFAEKAKRSSLRQAVRTAFESTGEKRSGELTLVITDDTQVKKLNQAYRGVDAMTDVLAFGDSLVADSFVQSPEVPIYFGDIVISYPRSVEQATAHGHPVEEELSLLVIHGVLHLLGYDHEKESGRERMWLVQSTALARLGINWQPLYALSTRENKRPWQPGPLCLFMV